MPRPLPIADLDHILQLTDGIWDELRGRRLFLTGGTGFFGHWLVESWAYINERRQLHSEAVVLTRNSKKALQEFSFLASNKSLTFHEGDVRDFVFPSGSTDYIVHAATTAAFAIDPIENFEVIVSGTKRVFDFARKSETRKVLLTSSGAVYGQQPSDLLNVPEDFRGGPDPSQPASTYGEGKRCAELLAALYSHHYGLEIKVARCFAFVGPHLPLNEHFAIGNFIRDGLAGGPIRVKGDGSPFRSYLYAADLAIWLWTLLFKAPAGRPFNVGSDKAIGVADLAKEVSSIVDPTVQVDVAQKHSGTPAARYVPDVSRAQKEMHLQVAIDRQKAIQKTIDWLAPK